MISCKCSFSVYVAVKRLVNIDIVLLSSNKPGSSWCFFFSLVHVFPFFFQVMACQAARRILSSVCVTVLLAVSIAVWQLLWKQPKVLLVHLTFVTSTFLIHFQGISHLKTFPVQRAEEIEIKILMQRFSFKIPCYFLFKNWASWMMKSGTRCAKCRLACWFFFLFLFFCSGNVSMYISCWTLKRSWHLTGKPQHLMFLDIQSC